MPQPAPAAPVAQPRTDFMLGNLFQQQFAPSTEGTDTDGDAANAAGSFPGAGFLNV